jgi:hypothetical protein
MDYSVWTSLLALTAILVVTKPTAAQPTFDTGVAPNGLPDGASATNVIEEAPQFYAPAAGDYRPDKPAGSPLVDLAGSDAPRDGRLLNGQTQTADGWDAGALESNGTALPVELTRFAGTAGEDAVRLTWRTASETGNAGFQVQRRVVDARASEAPGAGAASDGSWTSLSRVDGAGTTTTPQRYRFSDADLPFAAERLEYRLMQVDLGGSTAPSRTLRIERPAPTRVRLRPPSPNPARSTTTVRLALPKQSDSESAPEDGSLGARLTVYDVLGRRIETRLLEASGGVRRRIRLDVSRWPSGRYFVRLRAGGHIHTEQLTVVR